MSSRYSTQHRSRRRNIDWRDFGKYRGRILHKEAVTHDVSLYIVEKPDDFEFQAGHAVELSIDREGWRNEKRPFTITSLPNNPRLQFIIKSYPSHEGVTRELQRNVDVNDRVIFGDPSGAIEYQGPGIFIAGGAGITPFIAILRELEQTGELPGNRLFFSNKTHNDIILQGELFRMLGRDIVCTLTRELHPVFEHGHIDRGWLAHRVDDFDQPFYLCGPPKMVRDVKTTLLDLGANEETLIYEEIADEDE